MEGEKRGRPKEFTEETRPTKYEYKFTNPDGSYEIVKYDYEIQPNGPISIETFDAIDREEIPKTETNPKEYKFSAPPDNDKLPPTKRRYYNEATGKWVAYFRAKQLGII